MMGERSSSNELEMLPMTSSTTVARCFSTAMLTALSNVLLSSSQVAQVSFPLLVPTPCVNAVATFA